MKANRRALANALREQAKAWPIQLAPVPEAEWPRREGKERPIALWRSRHYLAAVYEEKWIGDTEIRRLSVNRVTLGRDGRWEQFIPWDDLQLCKHETGHGDWYGIEIYPRDRDLVNVANMRHLWLLSEPLAIGWFG